jgi:hypothetical protein
MEFIKKNQESENRCIAQLTKVAGITSTILSLLEAVRYLQLINGLSIVEVMLIEN